MGLTRAAPRSPLTRRRWLARGVAQGLGRQMQSTYRTLVLLIIESGLVITVAKIAEFTLFQLSPDDGLGGLNALYIVFEMIPHINVRSTSLLHRDRAR